MERGGCQEALVVQPEPYQQFKKHCGGDVFNSELNVGQNKCYQLESESAITTYLPL